LVEVASAEVEGVASAAVEGEVLEAVDLGEAAFMAAEGCRAAGFGRHLLLPRGRPCLLRSRGPAAAGGESIVRAGEAVASAEVEDSAAAVEEAFGPTLSICLESPAAACRSATDPRFSRVAESLGPI